MGYGNDKQMGGSPRFSVRIGKDELGRPRAKFVLRCNAGDEGAVAVVDKDGTPVVDKDGKQRWRKEYTFIEGHLVALDDHEVEFNGKTLKFLNLVFSDADGTYVLSLQRSDRYWVDFLFRLPGIDLTKAVHASPYSIEQDGKWNQGIVIHQDGKKIMNAYHRENDWGGMAKARQVEFNGEVKWDFGPRDKWLEENPLAKAREVLARLTAESPIAGEAPQQVQQAVPQQAQQQQAPAGPPPPDISDIPPGNEDDLPF